MRFRHTQGDINKDVVTTHCTIDSGDGTPQTAITFRSSADSTDVLVVNVPYPKSVQSLYDYSSTSKW